jgi:hypothetical protein
MSNSDTKLDVKTSRLLDVRTVERNIKKGLVTRKDYDRHLQALADGANKAATATAAAADDDEDDLDDIEEEDDETTTDAPHTDGA